MEQRGMLIRIKSAATCAVAAFIILLFPGAAFAQGAVTPSYGDGKLTLNGEGYGV